MGAVAVVTCQQAIELELGFIDYRNVEAQATQARGANRNQKGFDSFAMGGEIFETARDQVAAG
jgi:hypothetical protein